MNLLEQQTANRHRTWLVMILFVTVLGVAGAGLDYFVLGQGVGFPIGTLGAVALGSGSAWMTMRFGDRAILASALAEPVEARLASAASDDDRLRYQQFKNIVEEMAIASGQPVPAAYVIPDDDANAFATGRDPEHASIAVTEGLLRALNREELQGVVAHEMGHVKNLDIRLMMMVAALVGAVVLIADWSGRSMRFGGGRRSEKKGGAAVLVFFVIWVIAIVLAPLVARLLAMSVSRTREYLADASGAELTRNPAALASALRKIDAETTPTEAIKRGSAALCIADPVGRSANDREGRWANLWATHPPMAKRIEALDAMAYQRTVSP
jgi:heat shock protein HtpX